MKKINITDSQKNVIFVIVIVLAILGVVAFLFYGAFAEEAEKAKTKLEFESNFMSNISINEGSTKNRAQIRLCFDAISPDPDKKARFNLYNVIDPAIQGFGIHNIAYSKVNFNDGNCSVFEVPKNRDVEAYISIQYKGSSIMFSMPIST